MYTAVQPLYGIVAENVVKYVHHMAYLKFRFYRIQFRPGLCPDPSGRAYNAPPDLLVGWRWGYPIPIPHPLDALGISLSTHSASRLGDFGTEKRTPEMARKPNFWSRLCMMETQSLRLGHVTLIIPIWGRLYLPVTEFEEFENNSG